MLTNATKINFDNPTLLVRFSAKNLDFHSYVSQTYSAIIRTAVKRQKEFTQKWNETER